MCLFSVCRSARAGQRDLHLRAQAADRPARSGGQRPRRRELSPPCGARAAFVSTRFWCSGSVCGLEALVGRVFAARTRRHARLSAYSRFDPVFHEIGPERERAREILRLKPFKIEILPLGVALSSTRRRSLSLSLSLSLSRGARGQKLRARALSLSLSLSRESELKSQTGKALWRARVCERV